MGTHSGNSVLKSGIRVKSTKSFYWIKTSSYLTGSNRTIDGVIGHPNKYYEYINHGDIVSTTLLGLYLMPLKVFNSYWLFCYNIFMVSNLKIKSNSSEILGLKKEETLLSLKESLHL